MKFPRALLVARSTAALDCPALDPVAGPTRPAVAGASATAGLIAAVSRGGAKGVKAARASTMLSHRFLRGGKKRP
jgi:hypothetical protein